MRNFRNIKHIFFIIAISLTLLFVAYLFVFSNFITPLNHFITYRANESWLNTIHEHKLTPSKDIVIVEIDEKTTNELMNGANKSMLTISKFHYGKLVENLQTLGAKAIWFDIIFQNPDTEENEKFFVEKMKNFGNVTIGVMNPWYNNALLENYNLDQCSGNQDDIYSLICPYTPRAIYAPIRWWDLSAHIGVKENYINNKKEDKRYLDNDTKLVGRKITDIAMQNAMKFSEENTNIRPGDDIIYTLPVAMMLTEDNPVSKKIIKNAERAIKTKTWNNINTNLDGLTLIQPYFHEKNFSKKEKIYENFSMVDLLDSNDLTKYKDQFRGKYVLIGESGTMIHDNFISPATKNIIAWVYSHAFVLDAILQDKMLKKISDNTTFILSILLTIFFVIIYYFLPKYIWPIIALVSFFAIIWIARYSYDIWRIIFDVFPFFLAISFISFPVTYIYKFFIVEKDKRFIMNTFSRYISPEVVKLIDTTQVEATLGGEKKELSILFSDIAGFTTISEKLDTKELFVVMTKYLSEMTEVLVDNKWTLDKYIGDAVMGFFGAPVDDDFHAVNACKTALAMRAKLGDFNKWLVSKWHETIDFRVGIATGEVLVGNIGSEKQFNYTVLGDVVNLASRLEGTGKEYGVNIIIASSTRLASGNGFLVRELDYIAVKWKNEGVRIYELVGALGDNIDMTPYTTYESALRLYRDGKYMDAGRVWESLAATDKPSEIMMHRCVALIKWEMSLENGIYKMTHK